VFFTNEEPPYFQSAAIGSMVYAKRCHERNECVAAMLSLETIGYYSDEPRSQTYPWVSIPVIRTGATSWDLLRTSDRPRWFAPLSGASDRQLPCPPSAPLPRLRYQASVGPITGPSGQYGYRALMLTDTAPYRYPYYHSAQDTPEKVDYERLARAVTGIEAIVRHLASD